MVEKESPFVNILQSVSLYLLLNVKAIKTRMNAYRCRTIL